MRAISKRNNSIFLVMAFPMLLVLMPRPNIPGIHFLTYPITAFILVYLLLIMGRKLNFDKTFMSVVFFLYFFTLSIALSATLNMSQFPFGSMVEVFKPILFLIILTFGYAVGVKKDYGTVKRGLLKSAYVILVFQIVVSLPQLLNVNVFDFLYSGEKSTGIGNILRLSGTLANPNFFAWIVIQMALLIFVFEKKKVKRFVWLFLALALLLLSGSRSTLVLFPVIMFTLNLFLTKKNTNFYLKKLPVYVTSLLVTIAGAYWFILKFGMHFPYLNQLLLIVESGSLSSINSFGMRLTMWENGMSKVSGSWITWMFGLGPGSVSVLDNDYIYAVVNYGIIGLVSNMLIYISLFSLFSRIKQREFGAIGKTYIVFAMLIGLQADTLIGWNYPLLIMFYAGLAAALYRKRNEPEVDEKHEQVKHPKKRRRKRYRIVW